jgi:RND family efflux transporter, MFP subunit
MKSKIIKAVIACLVIGALGFGAFVGYNKFFKKKTASAAAQYYTATVKKMNLSSSVQGTGAAYAAVTKDVSAGNNGTLNSLSVKVGDTVTSGQKLFVADSDDVRKSVTNAENNLAKANLSLTSDQSAEKVDANKVASDQIAVSDAQDQLTAAKKQLSNMTVKAPISGIVTAVNNSNGDSVQSGKAVLTIQDTSSMKIKMSVDELDVGKIQVGQKAQITFDAISSKTYEGAVETISPVGTTSNNVTNYDVVVVISSPSGIRLGMNGNVTILVENKENALVIPAEALIESNGQKFVRVADTATAQNSTNTQNNTTTQNNTQSNTQSNSQNSTQNNGQQSSAQQSQNTNGQSKQANSGTRNSSQVTTSTGRLVAIKTGLETQNYIEVTEGLTEGQQVLVQLPQSSTTTNNNNNKNSFGNMNGMTGGFGGDMGGQRPQGAPSGSSTSKN